MGVVDRGEDAREAGQVERGFCVARGGDEVFECGREVDVSLRGIGRHGGLRDGR